MWLSSMVCALNALDRSATISGTAVGGKCGILRHSRFGMENLILFLKLVYFKISCFKVVYLKNYSILWFT